MSLCLALDSSGRGGSVVLAESRGGDAVVLARAEHEAARGNAESLFGLFDEVLTGAGRSKSQLQRVAVVQGPGSFTGLRIGIMTAKGLAYALGCELWSAPSLPLLQAGAGGRSVALVGAGRDFAFASPGAGQSTEAERLDAAGLAACASGAGASELRYSSSDPVAAQLAQGVASSGLRASAVELAVELALLAARGSLPAARVEPAELLPIYLAPSQAERTHGIDLGDAVHTPEPPESWG